jgi:hypothetical protein
MLKQTERQTGQHCLSEPSIPPHAIQFPQGNRVGTRGLQLAQEGSAREQRHGRGHGSRGQQDQVELQRGRRRNRRRLDRRHRRGRRAGTTRAVGRLMSRARMATGGLRPVAATRRGRLGWLLCCAATRFGCLRCLTLRRLAATAGMPRDACAAAIGSAQATGPRPGGNERRRQHESHAEPCGTAVCGGGDHESVSRVPFHSRGSGPQCNRNFRRNPPGTVRENHSHLKQFAQRGRLIGVARIPSVRPTPVRLS